MQFFKTKLILLSGLAICLISLPVFAGMTDEINQSNYQREFKFLDVDGNGKLSTEELKKDEVFDNGGFSKADKNHDGKLSEDEYASYKSAMQQKESKRIAIDSSITTKVKTKYLLEKNFRSFKVSVETKDGIVILSGFVNDEATKNRADQIAKTVKGVKSVSNGLIVKP
jgi:hyperosmotically inducible periplasmic protein